MNRWLLEMSPACRHSCGSSVVRGLKKGARRTFIGCSGWLEWTAELPCSCKLSQTNAFRRFVYPWGVWDLVPLPCRTCDMKSLVPPTPPPLFISYFSSNPEFSFFLLIRQWFVSVTLRSSLNARSNIDWEGLFEVYQRHISVASLNTEGPHPVLIIIITEI